MNPNQKPGSDKIVATDEFFEGQSVRSQQPNDGVSEGEESTSPPPEEAEKTTSPFHDYVRELQQEYEQQQEEGKINP